MLFVLMLFCDTLICMAPSYNNAMRIRHDVHRWKIQIFTIDIWSACVVPRLSNTNIIVTWLLSAADLVSGTYTHCSEHLQEQTTILTSLLEKCAPDSGPTVKRQ